MKIQYNICVKQSKIFLIWERTPLPNSSMVILVTILLFEFLPLGKTPLPNSSLVILVTIPPFEFLPLGKTSLPQFFNSNYCYYSLFQLFHRQKEVKSSLVENQFFDILFAFLIILYNIYITRSKKILRSSPSLKLGGQYAKDLPP